MAMIAIRLRMPTRNSAKQNKPIFIGHTQPGFEAIVAEQLPREYDDLTVLGTRVVPGKNGMVLFEYDGDPHDLLEQRTLEDLFVLVLSPTDIEPTYVGLKALRAAVAAAQLDTAIGLARQFIPGAASHGKLRYRVIARQNERAFYRRIDAQEAVEKGLGARTDFKWQRVEEKGLEFWLTILPGEAFVAVRLSDETMRHREEKQEHLPASLRPSAAAALVWLTRPKDNDVFLDPMCGAATTLIERAHAGRYEQLLGGDIRAQAVSVARSNIGSRYKPIEIQEWDARSLPLEDAAVGPVVVNLPFGKQIGSTSENRTLYPAVLKELNRVMRIGGRLVALTADTRAFEDALRRSSGFRQQAAYNVQVLGQRARVYVLMRLD